MKKKILSSVLCLAMLSSMVTTVFADTTAADTTTVTTNSATSTADLTADALVFDLEVPTSLPITVDNTGKVEVATDAQITNNSGGMVKVTNVSLDTTDSGWTIVGYETDFTKEKVGLTQFGITLNSDEVDTDGSLSLGSEWVSLSANGGTLDIDYEVNIASQSSALDLAIATVEFTLDWDSVDIIDKYIVSYIDNPEYLIAHSGSFTIEGEGDYSAGDLVTITVTFNAMGTGAYPEINSFDTLMCDGEILNCISAEVNISGISTFTFYMPSENMVVYLAYEGVTPVITEAPEYKDDTVEEPYVEIVVEP